MMRKDHLLILIPILSNLQDAIINMRYVYMLRMI